jgi:polyhydroxyalkanoate synthase subunit PhaC
VQNNLCGDSPPAFDVLAWNADSTSLPAPLHAQFLDICQRNLLARGELTVQGSLVDLAKVECDTLVVAGRTDHLVPWQACYANTKLFGGTAEFVLSSSGHIQCLVNPPGSPKMSITTGGNTDGGPEEWLSGAVERPGVWWEHWADWQAPRSGRGHRPPHRLGSQKHPVGVAAPGDYVRNR